MKWKELSSPGRACDGFSQRRGSAQRANGVRPSIAADGHGIAFALNAAVVQTTGYAYHLYDIQGTELLAYHRHPRGSGSRPEPHLHVRATIGEAHLSRMHLPTGRVSLEAFVRLLMMEFAISPLQTDWQQILDVAEQSFIETRMWA